MLNVVWLQRFNSYKELKRDIAKTLFSYSKFFTNVINNLEKNEPRKQVHIDAGDRLRDCRANCMILFKRNHV